MWTTRKLGDHAHEIHFEDAYTNEGWEQWVLITGDRHWDNKKSDWDLQRKHLEQAKERNAPIIDVGDFFCLMQGKYDKRKSASALRPIHSGDDYFDAVPLTAVDFFKPYAHQFAVIGMGNHETAILRHHQVNITDRFIYRLNKEAGSNAFRGGYGGWVKLRVSLPEKKAPISLWLKYHHGHGGGGRVSRGTLNAQRSAEIYPDADIVVQGHIHERWSVEVTREAITDYGKVELKPQYSLCVSTYKQEYDPKGGWHYERGAPPKPLGGWWLRLTSKKVGTKRKLVVQTVPTN